MINKKLLIFAVLLIVIIASVIIVKSEREIGELKVTSRHPFYVDGEWIKAENLEVGDKLTTADGKKAVIKNIEKIREEVEVYNMHVDSYENYFANNILVHNKPVRWDPEADFIYKGKFGLEARLTVEGRDRLNNLGPKFSYVGTDDRVEILNEIWEPMDNIEAQAAEDAFNKLGGAQRNWVIPASEVVDYILGKLNEHFTPTFLAKFSDARAIDPELTFAGYIHTEANAEAVAIAFSLAGKIIDPAQTMEQRTQKVSQYITDVASPVASYMSGDQEARALIEDVIRKSKDFPPNYDLKTELKKALDRVYPEDARKTLSDKKIVRVAGYVINGVRPDKAAQLIDLAPERGDFIINNDILPKFEQDIEIQKINALLREESERYCVASKPTAFYTPPVSTEMQVVEIMTDKEREDYADVLMESYAVDYVDYLKKGYPPITTQEQIDKIHEGDHDFIRGFLGQAIVNRDFGGSIKQATKAAQKELQAFGLKAVGEINYEKIKAEEGRPRSFSGVINKQKVAYLSYFSSPLSFIAEDKLPAVVEISELGRFANLESYGNLHTSELALLLRTLFESVPEGHMLVFAVNRRDYSLYRRVLKESMVEINSEWDIPRYDWIEIEVNGVGLKVPLEYNVGLIKDPKKAVENIYKCYKLGEFSG
jgi:hypothetical protein